MLWTQSPTRMLRRMGGYGSLTQDTIQGIGAFRSGFQQDSRCGATEEMHHFLLQCFEMLVSTDHLGVNTLDPRQRVRNASERHGIPRVGSIRPIANAAADEDLT